MELSKSQQEILQRLKVRGPQSIKILSKHMKQTTMGVRQHLTDMRSKGFATQTKTERQTRGRPLNLWRLTKKGHQYFENNHTQTTLDLIETIQKLEGGDYLRNLVHLQNRPTQEFYRKELANTDPKLNSQITRLAELRNEEGYMAEVRLLPEGWLLTQNHCPIYSAAKHCSHFCEAELACFQQALGAQADIERVDHVFTGSRRCTFKITATNGQKSENF